MPRNYKKLQRKITFDAPMKTLSGEFAKVSDHRVANAKYELADLLRSGFAMFSLKSPSLLSFNADSDDRER